MRGIDALFRRPDRTIRFLAITLLVWPVVHFVLVRSLDVSSWRFGGWAMYATLAPRTSDVAVIVRSCHAPSLLPSRHPGGPRMVILETDAARLGGLALDEEGHRLARDLSALRQIPHTLAFDAWFRRAHGIDAGVPIALAVIEPRIDVREHRAVGHARVAIVRDGEIVERDRFLAAAARFDAMLPPCEDAP